MSSLEQKSIKVIEFTGKDKDWKIWSKKFLAQANRKGYKKLLTGAEVIPTESEYTAAAGGSTDAEKLTVKLWQLNELAFEEILLSINGQTKQGKIAFNLVDNCSTAEQPEGNCKIAWERLVHKYAPKTAPSYIQLKKDFANSKLASVDTDPDEWMTDLECLRSEMNKVQIPGKTDMSEVDLIIHILSNLPEEYEVAVSELEEKLKNTSTPLSIETVREKLNSRYERMTKNAEAKEEEKALAAFKKQYKGRCSKCGEYGHKSADCSERNKSSGAGNSSENKKFDGECYYCGKKGHRKSECRKLVADNAKKQKEQGKTAIEEVDEDDKSVESSAELGFVARGIELVKDDAAMFCTIDGEKHPSFTDDTMFGDTGASCTIVTNDKFMYDVVAINERIGGIGSDVKATKKGKMRGLIKQADGTKTVKDLFVKYCERAKENLFSITQELSKGAKLGSDDSNNITLNYPDGSKITFDRRMKTRDGWVSGVDVVPIPITNDVAKLSQDERKAKPSKSSIREKTVNINEYHCALGHPSEATTRATAKAYGVKLVGQLKPCENCALSKAKAKKINKAPVKRATTPGGRLCIDISSPSTKSIGGKCHWLLVVDDCTDYAWSFFLKKKSETKDIMIALIKELKQTYGITVKSIRCDNSGENNALQKSCKQEGLGITFEYTAPDTPQQNGRVERRFPTLYGRVRAMLQNIGASINNKRLWAEAANTATDLDNMLIKQGETMNSFHKFFGKGVKSIIPMNSAKTFGEMVVVAKRNKVKAKLDDRGKTCIWLGYAKDHAIGTYRVYNPRTNKVSLTRDVTFLRESHNDWVAEEEPESVMEIEEHEADPPVATQNPVSTVVDDESDEDDDIPPLVRNNNYVTDSEDESEDEDELEVVASPVTTVNHKVIRAMRKLSTSYNPEASAIAQEGSAIAQEGRVTRSSANTDNESGRDSTVTELANILIDVAKVANEAKVVPQYVEPKTFQEAWNHPDPKQRAMWREAIRKEFHDMIKRKVWRRVKKSSIPSNRRCVKCKWVFKIKRNGVFRARLVACGYSQIPGVDFSESYSPVANDITIRLLLVAMILFGLSAKIVDVETAFLYGDLEEEVYMENPEGLEDSNDDEALLLLTTIYGLVQSARQYYKKARGILRKIGFTGGDVDPCLFVKKSSKGIVYIALYVDDNLLVGHPEAIDDAIQQMKKHGLILKIEDDLKDYLSCEVQFSEDKKKAWLGQPHLISNLKEKFGDYVKKLREYKTPGTPGLNMIRNTDDKLALSKEKQSLYRSGVGMLLYLVKYSRPDIANAVRELSKVLDGSTEASFKEMLRVIKYILDTKDMGLRIEPTLTKSADEPWDLVCYSDSDYAGDPDTRRSVSGYILYVKGVPISWRSKAQRSITLSSSEAEWFALSEATKEIMFVLQLLESMHIKVQLPITIRVDNIGAIWMSQNANASARTKHIDIRTKYVNEYCEDGVLKIIFVKSAENDSDIMTKNLGGELHSKHSNKLIKARPK